MKAVFGARTLRTLSDCATLSERLGVALSPAIVFYSALATIDPNGKAISATRRETAFERTISVLAETEGGAGGEPLIARMFANIEALTEDLVTPFDLLVASADAAADAVDAGLAVVETSARSVIQSVRDRFSGDELGDEVGSSPETAFRFAVIVEGPGFRDDRNRYPTLDVAQRAVKAFDQLSRGDAITHDDPHDGFFMIDPPRVKEATRIYVREL